MLPGAAPADEFLSKSGVLNLRSVIEQNSPNPGSPWLPGTPKYQAFPGGGSPRASTSGFATANVPLWTGSFAYNHVTYKYTMVGTNPAAGSKTTTVPVVIIPIKFVFQDGSGVSLSASSPVCGSTKTATQLTTASPLFTNYPFTAGAVALGNTQYIDAFQRANFWKTVSTTAPNYHVLLGTPVVKPLQTVNVDIFTGYSVAGPCKPLGIVDIDAFDAVAQQLLTKLAIPATTLPIFLDYNTFFSMGTQCCALGYHNVTGANQTYIVSAFNDPYVFSDPMLEDVEVLSHEIGEWMDDPLTYNQVPPWDAGQSQGCGYPWLEVGDPVSGAGFSVIQGGVTYHLEDLAFLPWFAHTSTSTSVNGWYTFLNSYTKAPPLNLSNPC